MARAIWTGAVSFGLVTVPVGLYSATQEHKVRFRQIERGTSDRVRIKRVNERTGEEVAFNDIVKGYDLGDDTYAIIEPSELDDIAPGRSRLIEIAGFVDPGAVDPRFYDSSYYLAPRGEEFGQIYALFLEALEETGKIGVGTFVMRGSQYLTAIRPNEQGALELHTLHYADEVRDPAKELPQLPGHTRLAAEQLAMAKQLIEAMSIEWNPADYRDEFQDKIRALIDAKRAGEEIVHAAEAPGATNVVDLMEALRRSLDRSAPSDRGAQPDPEPEAAEETATVTRVGQRRTSAQLDSMTKAQLYELASELHIAGRSNMTREQLQDAVRKAGRKRGAA
ncbi:MULTISPECIES: Ku protein [Streptacidiphilus]|uniref:Non-homologous end joining protein Ku n=1 Tax=Streptacidiphilus cavernicola TaxID=3342716 RepID=A0ABV6UWL1_9ACTN|nr:Ku protein [Streptacidiphilus jeojiense]